MGSQRIFKFTREKPVVRIINWKLDRYNPEREAHFKLLGCVLATPIYWGLQRIFHTWIFFPLLRLDAFLSSYILPAIHVGKCQSSQDIRRNYCLNSLILEITFLERNKDEQTWEGSFSSPALVLFLTTKVSWVVVLCSSSWGNIYEELAVIWTACQMKTE